MLSRERMAYSVANLAAQISPFWRFRLWARLVGGDPYRIEKSSTARRRKVRPHGYEMELFEADWMERYALHSGYYYQDEISTLIAHCVNSGDVFVDIGANVGFVSLIAASRVGAAGHVYSFEPNPVLVRRLKQTVAENGIANVSVFESALGDAAGTVRLIAGEHHGTNRISVGDESPLAAEIAISRGDDLLHGRIPEGVPLFVKIDVEGAELAVLKGIPSLLQRPDTQFFVEVGDEHSARFGSTADDIFRLFADAGYAAYFVRLAPFRPGVKLTRADGPKANRSTYDVFFRKEASRA
jgi:FkbM family methyltransferase